MTIELTKEQVIDLWDEMLEKEKDNALKIVELIDFANCHEVARYLYLQDEETAVSLYEELSYWISSRSVR